MSLLNNTRQGTTWSIPAVGRSGNRRHIAVQQSEPSPLNDVSRASTLFLCLICRRIIRLYISYFAMIQASDQELVYQLFYCNPSNIQYRLYIIYLYIFYIVYRILYIYVFLDLSTYSPFIIKNTGYSLLSLM